MALYNWQQEDWLEFKFSLHGVEDNLLVFSEKVGRVSGILEGLPEEPKQNVIVDIILAEAIKTSEIEGEYPKSFIIGISELFKEFHNYRNVRNYDHKL